jgi:starch-binding outer membrane protein, SusD/RagB family
VQLFGEVPLITTTSPTTTEQTTRKSIDEVYAQAIKDLTEASAKLPWYDSNKSVPTKWAAKTILAKVYLTWGQKPLTQEEVTAISSSTQDPTKPAVDVQKLTRAVELADSVIKSNKYAILDNFNDIWGVGNENNDEVIFSIHHDGDGIDSQGNHQTHCGFTWPKSERTDPHISYADITLENLLPDGDARKLYSLVTKVSYKDGNIDTLTWPLSIVRPGKWIHRSQEGTNIALDNQPNNIDHIDFRLAEVYLIKAEAQFFLNSGDEGLAAINKLRERANVQPLSSVTQQDLFNEWSYEFTFEQKNWLNLVRWRTLISSVKKVTGYEYYKAAYNDQTQFNALSGADPTRFAFYQRIYKHLHAKADHINGHFYRFPIPLSESYTSQGITPQNPGY